MKTLRKVAFKIFIIAITALSLVTASPGWTQTRYAALASGMNYKDVIEVLGSPLTRQEKEIRREDVWSYPKLRVVFKEGKVIGWDSGKSKDIELVSDVVSSSPKPVKENKVDPIALEEILSEIMGVSGGDDDSPGGDTRPGGLPKTYTPPPPVMAPNE